MREEGRGKRNEPRTLLRRYVEEFCAAKNTSVSSNSARNVMALLHGLEGDELDVIGLLIERVRYGTQAYGHLDIEADRRDFLREALDEDLDSMFYRATRLLKVGGAAREAIGGQDG